MQKFILYYIVPGSILLVMALVFSGFLPAIPQPSNVQHSQDYRLGDVEMHFLNLLANVQKNLPSKEDSLQSDFQQNIIREDPFKNLIYPILPFFPSGRKVMANYSFRVYCGMCLVHVL